MWMAKGLFLGIWLFGYGTIVMLYLTVYHHISRNTAVDARIITGQTIHNPVWWIAGVACLVLGCAMTRSWSGPLAVWIALVVTGLVPAGLLAVFVVLMAKAKAMRLHS